MATAATAAARGPLHALLHASAGTQWLALGLAVYTYAAPDKVLELLQPLLTTAGRGLLAASPNRNSDNNNSNRPIIIHAGGGGNGDGNNGSGGSRSGTTAFLVTTLVTYCAGAGAVWVSYTVLSNWLPDSINQLLPVTRQVFDRAAQNLAHGIHAVKDVLGRQLLTVMEKQDELGRKQDETAVDVRDVRDHLAAARGDLVDVAGSLGRCEASLEDAQRLQTYTARGVQLLVRSVSALLPADDRMTRDLQAYAREREAVWKNGTNNNNNNNNSGGGARTISSNNSTTTANANNNNDGLSVASSTCFRRGHQQQPSFTAANPTGSAPRIPQTIESPGGSRSSAATGSPAAGPEEEHPHNDGGEQFDLRAFVQQGPVSVS